MGHMAQHQVQPNHTLCAAEALLVISAVAVSGRGLSPGWRLLVGVWPPQIRDPPLLPGPHRLQHCQQVLKRLGEGEGGEGWSLPRPRVHLPYPPCALKHRGPCSVLPLTSNNVCHCISSVLTQLEGVGLRWCHHAACTTQWSAHVTDM